MHIAPPAGIICGRCPLAINCSCGLQVFMVPADAKLDEETMTKIYRSGHSRIPVHKVGRRWGCVGLAGVHQTAKSSAVRLLPSWCCLSSCIAAVH